MCQFTIKAFLIKVLNIYFSFVLNMGNMVVTPPDVISVIKISVPREGRPKMRR
jgi:hypothetical protein